MKREASPRAQLGNRRGAEPLLVRTALAVLLALGLAMIAAGVVGMRAFNASGYDSEAGYSYIYQMKGALESHYASAIAPALDDLSAEERARTNEKLSAMLIEYWGELRGDEEAARTELETFIASLSGMGREAAVAKLFDAAFAVDGPKISSSIKKTARGAR